MGKNQEMAVSPRKIGHKYVAVGKHLAKTTRKIYFETFLGEFMNFLITKMGEFEILSLSQVLFDMYELFYCETLLRTQIRSCPN